MACQSRDIVMSVKPLDFFTSFDRQRYLQYSPEDAANWTQTPIASGKRQNAMYPVLGRRHLNVNGQNRLQFAVESREMATSDNFGYIVVGSVIYQINPSTYVATAISQGKVSTNDGIIDFDYLVTPSTTYCAFADGQNLFVFDESTNAFELITDPSTPTNSQYVVAFGNRFAVAGANSSEFRLTAINALASTTPATIFSSQSPVPFAQERGIIKGFGVLHNTLYIFTNFTTGVWSNNPSIFQNATFPWRKNTTYDWDFGLLDVRTLSIDFGLMCFVGQNKNGLVQVMVSSGQSPQPLSSKAVDILFERGINDGTPSPFLTGDAVGFLYQYENTVFYRLSAGEYDDTGLIDFADSAASIEYSFLSKKWSRCIEKNGQRCRVQRHMFLGNRHLVSSKGEGTVYEFSGRFSVNEYRNENQTDGQAIDAYIAEPFRYEAQTKIISQLDYSEEITDYVEIDFVYGVGATKISGAFENTVFLIAEDAGADGEPVYLIAEDADAMGEPIYLIAEDGNTPQADSIYYRNLFNPHIELYYSDDGGVSFHSADVREFSQLGFYEWRMRWYELGTSRNRVYKLVCVSIFPIVILGAVQSTRRASGGAN